DLPRIPERWNPDERATIHPRFYAGLFAIVVGVLITVVTYEGAASQGGGTYLIAYGPIVWGIINVIRGLGGR
ncbi:MAG: hypothetical protein KC464_08890, partial [Myxococcales bacterium]|nr:hypothetical protein [Myxococcales bacterium]